MSRTLAPWLIALAAAAITAGTAAPASAAPITDPAGPIGPNQHFEGLVNDKTHNAVIRTNCVGPLRPGQTGHPLPDQHVKAYATGDGFTGSAAHAIDVSYAPAASLVPLVVLHDYGLPALIPVTWPVPCFGPGLVRFTPAPTSKTAVTETVNVTFEPWLVPTPTPGPSPMPGPVTPSA